MVGSLQASQISNEGCSNNLGYIDSCELGRGALDGMIGELIQSSHQDTQEVQLLQQAQVESWETYMWENDRKSSEMDASIHKIEARIGQLAELLQEREKGRFPSQPEQARAKAILRSGKVLGDGNKEATEKEDDVIHIEENGKKGLKKEDNVEVAKPEQRPQLHKSPNPYLPPIPFPGELKNPKMEKAHQDIYDLLSKATINLPLLDAI